MVTRQKCRGSTTNSGGSMDKVFQMEDCYGLTCAPKR